MSKTMFDDDVYTSDSGTTGNSVIPAAAERPDRVPVVVRRGRTLVGRSPVSFRRVGQLRLVRMRLDDRGRAAVEKCRGGSNLDVFVGARRVAVRCRRAGRLLAGGGRAC